MRKVTNVELIQLNYRGIFKKDYRGLKQLQSIEKIRVVNFLNPLIVVDGFNDTNQTA